MDMQFFNDSHRLTDSAEITEQFYETVKGQYDKTIQTKIYGALDLASSAHATQYRSGDIPFILHPMRVALMLAHLDQNVTSNVFIAALLHDTLEHTGLEALEIEARFGQYVTELVRKVTMSPQKIAVEGNPSDNKWRLWSSIISDDHEVRAIKTFENLDNMLYWRAIPSDDPGQKKILLWLKETQDMSLPLAHATNLQAHKIMQKEYEYYATQHSSNRLLTI